MTKAGEDAVGRVKVKQRILTDNDKEVIQSFFSENEKFGGFLTTIYNQEFSDQTLIRIFRKLNLQLFDLGEMLSRVLERGEVPSKKRE